MAPLTIERTAKAAAAVVFTGVFVHTHNYAAIYGVAVGCGPYGWPLRIYALLALYKRIAELIKKKVSNTVRTSHCTSHILLSFYSLVRYCIPCLIDRSQFLLMAEANVTNIWRTLVIPCSVYFSPVHFIICIYCTVHTSIYCKLYSSNMYNCIELIIINHMSIYFLYNFICV
jgi:hypothetical protein